MENKEKFVNAEVEVITFEDDIITTSTAYGSTPLTPMEED